MNNKTVAIEAYIPSIKNDRKRALIEKALQMGVKIEVLSLQFRILKLINTDGKQLLMYDEQLFLNKKPATLFTKNKQATKILLSNASIETPRGVFAEDFQEALELLKENSINYPVVVKPIDAAKGYGVSVGVANDEQLNEAIEKIRHFWQKGVMSCDKRFLVEEMKSGNDFRVLVLQGKVVACANRIPAFLVGDGKSTIKELIASHNEKRPANYHLHIDGDLDKVLDELGLGLDTVLEQDKKITVRKNANISSGGISMDKTATISQRFQDIALKASAALGLKYAGIDVMTGDITSEDKNQDYCIIEINGSPDYDIHERPVVQGQGVDMAKLLVQALFRQ